MPKTLNLSEREKQQLKAMIDAGQPLPPRYRAVLFADPPEAELIWPRQTNSHKCRVAIADDKHH